MILDRTGKLVLIILIIAGGFIRMSCSAAFGGVTGSGNVITEERTVGSFNGITVNGSADVFLTQGPTSLKIVAEDNVIPLLSTEVVDGNLVIGFKKCTFWNVKPVKVYVSTNEIRNISINGSGDIKSESAITAEDLSLAIKGSGDMNLNLKANKLDIRIAGSGDISLSGAVSEQEISINGSGDCKTSEMVCSNATVNINGSGDVRLWVTESLNARINGSGDVAYKGEPKSVNKSIHGSGPLIKV